MTIAISMKTSEQTRDAVILLKSILLHTHTYINIHIMGTDSVCNTMNHLMFTWNLPTGITLFI